ncbi:MAG: hypothetical protein EBX50_22000, partial [Chitinophagia bacterium]|nr:hypothetical protein [Chitinophagia bacterium]
MSYYAPFIPGSKYIANGLISTYNSNTLGNLYTTGGNVGIATTSPAYALDVNGTVNISSAMKASSVTSGNIGVSGTISAGTHVGTLMSSASIGASGATIGTLYVTGITAGNINFTGNLYQNGSLYTAQGGSGGGSSQWTTTNGNISYTSGSVVASNLVTNNIDFGISSFYGAS